MIARILFVAPLLALGLCLCGCSPSVVRNDNTALFSHCLNVDVEWGTKFQKRDVMMCYQERGIQGIDYTLDSYFAPVESTVAPMANDEGMDLSDND